MHVPDLEGRRRKAGVPPQVQWAADSAHRDTAIYCSVDQSTDETGRAAIQQYFRGVKQAHTRTGYTVGMYGGKQFGERLLALGVTDHHWQANAAS